jgi:CheY-like chemotaxis protein
VPTHSDWERVGALRADASALFKLAMHDARATMREPPRQELDRVPSSAPIRRSEQAILVVDDNTAARYSLARSLRAAGFSTLEAPTGLEALKLVPVASALVLDLNLPDIDGMEICRLVRGNPVTARMPVVHVSAKFTEAVDVAASAKAGANVFLGGPVDAEHLARVLEALLTQAHAATNPT